MILVKVTDRAVPGNGGDIHPGPRIINLGMTVRTVVQLRLGDGMVLRRRIGAVTSLALRHRHRQDGGCSAKEHGQHGQRRRDKGRRGEGPLPDGFVFHMYLRISCCRRMFMCPELQAPHQNPADHPIPRLFRCDQG